MSKNNSEEIEFIEYLSVVILTWLLITQISGVVQNRLWEYQSEKVEVLVDIILFHHLPPDLH